MMLVRVLRLLLALALLSAQNAALSHQVWHFGDLDSQPAQKQLCDQHEALATVAGAVDAPVVLPCAVLPEEFSPRHTALPSADTPGLAPSSRGPPAFL